MLKSEFIKDILSLLLNGSEDESKACKQLPFLTEKESKYTGVGLFVFFSHQPGIEAFKIEEGNLILNGVVIKSSALKIGAEATLFFKNGLMDYLEIWSYDGSYPTKELPDYKLVRK